MPPEASSDRGATLGDVGEFGAIAELAALFEQGGHVAVGPGDDTAVLWSDDDQILMSTDVLVQGRHFRTDWAEAEDVGHRAAAANLSDVNAMGGRAHSLTLGLAAPADLPLAWARGFARGFAEECALVGACVVGGDLTRAEEIVVAVTVLGTCRLDPVLRSGATPGDVVVLVGRQGWAAGGLAVLRRGFRSPRALVDAYRRPEPPYDAGPRAADLGATAMIDVSDGLLADLAHVAASSQVAVEVDSASLEVAEPLRTVAAATGDDAVRFVLTGGDDHCLAATFPAGTALPAGWRAIGRVVEGEGVRVDGSPYDGDAGWTHF